jgi:hypothetical protein
MDKRLGGPRSRSGRGGEEKNSQPPPGIEPQNPDRPACSQSLYRLSYQGSDSTTEIHKNVSNSSSSMRLSAQLLKGSISKVTPPKKLWVYECRYVACNKIIPGTSQPQRVNVSCRTLCSAAPSLGNRLYAEYWMQLYIYIYIYIYIYMAFLTSSLCGARVANNISDVWRHILLFSEPEAEPHYPSENPKYLLQENCITILWVSLMSFAGIILCVALLLLLLLLFILLSIQSGNFWTHHRN